MSIFLKKGVPCHLIDQVVTSIKAENIMELNKDKIKKKNTAQSIHVLGRVKVVKKKNRIKDNPQTSPPPYTPRP